MFRHKFVKENMLVTQFSLYLRFLTAYPVAFDLRTIDDATILKLFSKADHSAVIGNGVAKL